MTAVGRLELVLGGMRSGKSAEAQRRAVAAERAGATVVVLATALAADDEMRARIAQHRADRPAHWHTLEVDATVDGLARSIGRAAAPARCVVIDCVTVWLSQLVCPPPGHAAGDGAAAVAALLDALDAAPGRVIVVSNEIGQGVVPLDAGTRTVVDALGRLHQALAARAARVTWMVAGLPLDVKGGPQ